MDESYRRRFHTETPFCRVLCGSLISGALTAWWFLQRLTRDSDGVASEIHLFIGQGFTCEQPRQTTLAKNHQELC